MILVAFRMNVCYYAGRKNNLNSRERAERQEDCYGTNESTVEGNFVICWS